MSNGTSPILLFDHTKYQLNPDFYNILVEFVFGKVWTRKILNTQSQEIVAITALITMGCVPELLKGHFHTALNKRSKRYLAFLGCVSGFNV